MGSRFFYVYYRGFTQGHKNLPLLVFLWFMYSFQPLDNELVLTFYNVAPKELFCTKD